MKLSELTYEYLKSVQMQMTSIHTDCSDALTRVESADGLERAKRELMQKYGDVEIEVCPLAPWYSRIKIMDAKWQADYADYCRRKAAWCSKNTAE